MTAARTLSDDIIPPRSRDCPQVMAWYDNDWGFTHQMIREARSIFGLPDAS